jgi:ribonuclease-3
VSAEDDAMAALEARIGRTFKRRALLAEALTHASLAEGRQGAANYERLEFLGDRVLGLAIAEILYAEHPGATEKDLALWFNALVNKNACARAARRVGLGEALRLGKAEANAGGRLKETILADAIEALIAALYLDGGFKAARGFIGDVWREEIAAATVVEADPKTRLQEWAAAQKRRPPTYVIVSREGPDHAPSFRVEAAVEGLSPAIGEAGSKREAERAAARAVLKGAGIDG